MTHNTVSSFRYFIALLVVVALLVGNASAKGPDKKEGVSPLAKTAGTPSLTMLNINNVASFFRSDGQGNHSPADQAGFYYPKGTTTAIYEDGFVWGGKVYTDAAHTASPTMKIRVGGQTYNQGTRAGKVNGFGAAAVAVSAADARSRVFRIRRDYASMTDNEVRSDAATLNTITENSVTADQMAAVRAQYATDWAQWPVDLGAPYIERNGTPGYQAPPSFSDTFTADNLISGKYDEPGIAGVDPNSPADQVIWTVYNDLDPSAVNGLYMSEPIGLEGQVTIWGYKRTDALGNLYFKRLKLINKGGVDVGTGSKGAFYVDSTYIMQWSDPDVGDSGDDLAGCDTTLSLGFAYNGNAVDLEYKKFGLAPAASGYDFLQGPLVPGGPTDSGIWDLKRVSGKKNLPMTSFVYFSAGSPISDPSLQNVAGASYESSLQFYRMLRGLRLDFSSVPERYYPFPPGVTPGPFTLTGDPVTGSGFVDGIGTDFSFPPGDRRILLSSGPFTLAPGDTQEVVVGTVAGLGSDRLSSVSIMKFNDGFVQNTYDALFAVPKAPAAPPLKYTEMDGQVVLEWGSDLTSVNSIENSVNMPGNYSFEGYNVYQLPSKSSALSEGKRLATYDLTSDPAVVLDLQFDAASGKILQKAVQFGTNSGITRFFLLDKDYIRDIPRLNNGSEYYMAVTAYSVSRSGYLPASLESQPNVYAVIPQPAKPGFQLSTTTGQNQAIRHATGTGDADMYLKVVDPAQLKGTGYTVGFYTAPDRFSAGYLNQGTDVNEATYTIYELTSSWKVLNEAQSQMQYNLKLTNLDSLTGPVTSAVLQSGPLDTNGVPTGAVIKNVPVEVTLVAGVRFLTGSGIWTSSDATQPLTKANIDLMAAGNVYLSLRTAANPGGEVVAPIEVLTYPWYLDRGTTRVLAFQQNYSYDPAAVVPDNTYSITDGFQYKVGGLTFKAPSGLGPWVQTVKAVASTRHFLPFAQGGFNFGDAMSWGYPDGRAYQFFGGGGSVTDFDLQQDLEFRFTGVRAKRADGTSPEDTLIVSGGSIATVTNSARSISKRVRIPFELWENDANGRTRQINCAIRSRNADAKDPWGSSGTPLYIRMTGSRAYIEAIAQAYSSDTSAAAITAIPLMNNPLSTWFINPAFGGTSHWDTGDIVHINIANTMKPGVDTFTWTTPTASSYDATLATKDVGRVNVFPNPYYAYNPLERSRTTRFVTFNGLPPQATLRIFNLAGQLVRTLRKDDGTQFIQWDLANQDNFPVASGMYIVHVDMPGIGATKVVKLAIIQEQEVPNNF